MRKMHIISRKLVKATIEEVDGIISKDYGSYSQKTKVFFEDRYLVLLEKFPALKKKGKVLEVGLSGGILALLLNKIYQPKQMFAIEHPTSIERYTTKFLKKIKKDGITLQPVDLTKPPFPGTENSLDLITFCDVMEHLIPASLPAIFGEFHRLLKKDGRLIIATPNIASLLKRLNLLRGKNPIEFDVKLHEGATYGHTREYTFFEIEKILEMAGFKVKNKSYFQIDAKRSLFTRIEEISAKLIPSLANSILVVAKKK